MVHLAVRTANLVGDNNDMKAYSKQNMATEKSSELTEYAILIGIIAILGVLVCALSAYIFLGERIRSVASEAKEISIDEVLSPVPFVSTVLPAEAIPEPENYKTIDLVGHIGGETHAVFIQGNFAYFGQGRHLTILDISNQANPVEVGKTPPFPEIVQDI